MLIKQESAATTANPNTTPPTPTICGNCGLEERRLLHHVRHRGMFRRLCTSCVLRLHPQSFCPTCFLVYETPRPPNDAAVTCCKCYSSSHSACVGPSPPNPYVCPSCTNPSLPIFGLKKGEGEGNEKYRMIDDKAAKVLLAAAQIGAVSMNKAAVAARAEAERRAKEAAFTRKRAREALEHVAFLVAKENSKRKEISAIAEASGSHNKVGDSRNFLQRNQIGTQNEVLAALNAVELKEKGGSQVLRIENSVSSPPSNGAAMDVEENERLKVISVAANDHLQKIVAEKVMNRVVSDPSGGDKPSLHMQNNKVKDENKP